MINEDGAVFLLFLAMPITFFLLAVHVAAHSRRSGSTPLRTGSLVLFSVLCVISCVFAFFAAMVIYGGLGD